MPFLDEEEEDDDEDSSGDDEENRDRDDLDDCLLVGESNGCVRLSSTPTSSCIFFKNS